MRFSLPSVDRLFEQVRNSFLRFPIALVIAVMGTVAAVLLVDGHRTLVDIPDRELQPWIIAALFGLPLAASSVLFGESRGYARIRTFILECSAAIVAALFYAFVLPGSQEFWGKWESYRATALVLAATSALLWVPFLAARASECAWRYVATLTRRAFLVGVFTAALFIGSALILQSLQYLFDAHIPDYLYAQVWVVVVGVIGVWAFLAGFPASPRSLTYGVYAKTLRAFVQYIAIPVLAIYGAILYAYGAKILFTWNLPEGGVVWLVLGYGVAGFAVSLSLLPLIEQHDERWAHRAVRGFALSLVPLLVLYAVAIGVRIAEYGVTEDRYFVVAAGVLLLAGAVYVIVARMRELVWMPIILACALILGVVGPWSAFATSERSQVGRLERILTEHGILTNGKIVEEGVVKLVAPTVNRKVESIVRYLAYANNAKGIRRWFSSPWSITSRVSPYDVVRLMGVADSLSSGVHAVDTDVVQVYVTRSSTFPVDGFDYALTDIEMHDGRWVYVGAYELKMSANALVLSHTASADTPVARFDLMKMTSSLLQHQREAKQAFTLSGAQATFESEDRGYRLRLHMGDARMRRSLLRMESFTGDILLDVP